MSQIIWMIILTVSVCAIILSAASGAPASLMAMSGIVSFAMAMVAIREHRQLEAANATRGAIAASTARHMGFIWIWGALGLLVSYGLMLNETWPSWPVYFAMLGAAAVACLVFASALDRDEKAGHDDGIMINLGKYLIIAQLLGMLAALVVIWLDPAKQLLSVANPDWVANNIFVSGAFALTVISAHALLRDKPAAPVAAATAN